MDDFIGARDLCRHMLFAPVLQLLIEFAPEGSDQRSTLESISNHLAGRGALVAIQHELSGTGAQEVENDARGGLSAAR